MFGKTIKRYCPECEKEISFEVSKSYRVNGVSVYTEGYNAHCKHDLFATDRATLQTALDEGQTIGNEIGVAMF